MSLLNGKKILITGVASPRSIASGIASAMHREGAQLAFTYQNVKLEQRVRQFAQQCGSEDMVFPCDVQRDEDILSLFASLEAKWEQLDGLVHSVAFANRDELRGSFVDNTTRSGFLLAHEVSSYSLCALAKHAQPLMGNSLAASIVTLSYLGAEKVVPNYNVMGLAKASLEANVRYLAADLGKLSVRVNCISAGPIKTLAASGILGFNDMLEHTSVHSPLRKKVTIEDIGNVAVFLSSDWSSSITGEIIHVDAGSHATAFVPSEKH